MHHFCECIHLRSVGRLENLRRQAVISGLLMYLTGFASISDKIWGWGGLTPCPPVPTALRLEPHRYYVGSTGCCACFTRRRKYFVLQVQWIMEFKFNTKDRYFHDTGHCWTGAWHCLGRGPAWVQPLWLS